MSAEKDSHTVRGEKPGPRQYLGGNHRLARAGCPGKMEGQGA